MAGIYIHIPFCKQACHYCNFHFSTLLKYKGKLVEAIGKEIFLRQTFLANEPIETVYFGGGTPSILSEYELHSIIDALNKNFDLSAVKEFTFEANPDDLTNEQINFLRHTPINRLSIGVQSFFDTHLQWMNRAHKSAEAIDCIKRAQDAGLTNISIDLIYGTPGLSEQKWSQNLLTTFNLKVPHVSAYCLTVEPKTALAKMIATHTSADVNDGQASLQFNILMQAMKENGFEHYEISNFAKPGKYALHNTNYWRGISYLGIGPGAHSFNKKQRSWNIANNATYVKGIDMNNPLIENETLTEKNLFNEAVMTSLRTQWGCSRTYIQETFGSSYLVHLDKELQNFIKKSWLSLTDNSYILTAEGKFFADGIAAAAFVI
ncbi:MAG: radical SAM family heme chaperone HemW [Bacteroidia bacterium]|nr:radical SAM family heme chaperone HemW [Bacteroidia bacterium]